MNAYEFDNKFENDDVLAELDLSNIKKPMQKQKRVNMITIRPYNTSDVLTLWSIFYHTVRMVSVKDYSLSQVKAWAPDDFDLDAWHKKMNQLKPFIAEIEGKIVGYADLQDDGLIDHFFCHHQYQGKGVGRYLMEHLFTIGKHQELTRFYSHVSITARPFYEKFGFKVVQEKMVEIRGQKLKNFLMEKKPIGNNTNHTN